MEVRDHEVRVVQVHVDAHHGQEQAGQAADGEQQQERQRVQHRASRGECEPLYMVATQLKTLMADGMATRNVRALKIVPASTRLAAHEHVVTPDQEAEQRDAPSCRRR